jgi:hypothetical protein
LAVFGDRFASEGDAGGTKPRGEPTEAPAKWWLTVGVEVFTEDSREGLAVTLLSQQRFVPTARPLCVVHPADLADDEEDE